MTHRHTIKLTARLLLSANLLVSLSPLAQTPVGERMAAAVDAQGRYIRWREHIIDDSEIAGFSLSGGDGLVMGDIDRDGFEDIVSVHESDAEYDSAVFTPGYTPQIAGHVRIAFGSADADRWVNVTLAEGSDAPAPEDAALADVNGDGFLDVVVAAELSHLIYLQNPGEAKPQGKPIAPKSMRTATWPRLILPMTKNRGSFIRAFLADFDGDGTPEIAAANKGAQTPGPEDYKKKTPVMVYRVVGDPLQTDGWREIELGKFSIPQNSEPVDLDGDGDMDIVVGSRGESRLVLFENTSPENNTRTLAFRERAVEIEGFRMGGFNLEYADMNHNGRLDIVGTAGPGGQTLLWIEQPRDLKDPWKPHLIGNFAPDILVGLEIADIDGDGAIDVMAGGYSRGERTQDTQADPGEPSGRISWFRNPNATGDSPGEWSRHDISRRQRGMFDKFIARDLDHDGDVDFVGTRGNSAPYDGVFWLEQVRSDKPGPVFTKARARDSRELPIPSMPAPTGEAEPNGNQ